jgi:tetratricopeptide (TPR) repeat protein
VFKIGTYFTVMVAWLAPLQDSIQDAEAAFRSGDLNRAAILAKRVLTADPSSASAHFLLGTIASQNSDWAVATENFEAMVRLSPSDPRGYFHLGEVNIFQQKWLQAVQCFASALEHNYPDRERLIIQLALAENEAGRSSRALNRLLKMQPPQSGPSAAEYYAVTAYARADLNQPLEAVRAMERAIEIDTFNPQYRVFMISILLNTNQSGMALAEAIDSQKRFPDHKEIQYLFGLAGYNIKNLAMTRVALRNFSEVDPGNAQRILLEGMVHRLEGRGERATQEFLTAAKRGVVGAHLILGLVLKENGDVAGAEKELREAERVYPRNGQLELELGKLLLSRGETSQAAVRLKNAEQYMPTSATVHYELARLYARLGQKQRSNQYLRKFRELRKQETELESNQLRD